MSVLGICTLLRKLTEAHLFKLLIQLLDFVFHHLRVSFFGLASECIDITFLDVGKIVLHKLEICLHGLCEETSSTDMGVGFVPAGKLCCEPVVATVAPDEGTRAPPPEVSPVVLSMALRDYG